MTYQFEIFFFQVNYPSGVEVKEGNELTPTQVKDQPTVAWDAEPNTFYTVAMTGTVSWFCNIFFNIITNDLFSCVLSSTIYVIYYFDGLIYFDGAMNETTLFRKKVKKRKLVLK